MFSKMLHEILHFVNIPPNTRSKILKVFTVFKVRIPIMVLYGLTLKE
jgi:hypothetical protein